MSNSDEDRATAMYRNRVGTVSTELGTGPPVVFSHGTLMDRTMFAPQLEAVAGDYRCIAYDSRARTDQYAAEYDLWDLVEDCRAVVDAKGVESCVLVGMSMGGFTGLRFAHRYPERVDGLVLVDSVAEPHGEADREQYGQMIETVREQGDVPDQMAETVKHILFGQTTVQENPDLADAWAHRWRTYPGEAIYQEVQSWLHRPDFTGEARELEVPTLVLHGEEDVSIEMAEAERTAEAIPNAYLEPIPDAGHSSNLENPEAANAALREFLDEVY